jgi:hypothetical protein
MFYLNVVKMHLFLNYSNFLFHSYYLINPYLQNCFFHQHIFIINFISISIKNFFDLLTLISYQYLHLLKKNNLIHF